MSLFMAKAQNYIASLSDFFDNRQKRRFISITPSTSACTKKKVKNGTRCLTSARQAAVARSIDNLQTIAAAVRSQTDLALLVLCWEEGREFSQHRHH